MTDELPMDDFMQNRINGLYSGQELPAFSSLQEVKAMKNRIKELEAELAAQDVSGTERKYKEPVTPVKQANFTTINTQKIAATTDNLETLAKRVFRAAIVRFLAVLIALPFFIYAAIETQSWQMYTIAVAVTVMGATSIFSAWLTRKNKLNLAIGFVILVPCIVFPLASSLVAGMGALLGITFFFTSLAIVEQTLSGRVARQAILVVILSAGFTVAVDLFAPWNRLTVPLLRTTIPYIAVVAVLILGTFAIRPLWNRALENIRMSWKMSFMIGLLVLGIVGVATIGIRSLQRLQFHNSNIYQFMLIPIVSLDEANASLSDVQYQILVLENQNVTSTDRAVAFEKIRIDQQAFQAVFNRYQTEWITTSSPEFTNLLRVNGRLDLQNDEVKTVNAIASSLTKYNKAAQAYVTTVKSGQSSPSQAEATQAALEDLHNDFNHLVGVNQEFAKLSFDVASTDYKNALVNGGFAVLIALVLGLFVSYLIVVSMTRRLAELTRAAAAMQQGKLDQEIKFTGRDEVGSLATTFNSMSGQLNNLIGSLEQRVQDRTHDLELASEVGRNVSTKIGNLYNLLNEAVELIRESFNLYYTQVYIVDPSGRAITLRAGSGEVGKQLLNRGHHLLISSNSLNGRAASEKQTILVSNTGENPGFLPNPLLPKTRSEMTVPLIAGDRVVGVLDMQSNEVNALNSENQPAFEALAGQLAIAIQNAALFEQVEQARLEVEGQSRQQAYTNWVNFLNAIDRNEKVGYIYNQNEVLPLVNTLEEFDQRNSLQSPIIIAGTEIGGIHISDDPDRKWTSTEAAVINETATQLSRHIENLRLLAQSDKYRLEAEKITNRLTHENWNEYLNLRNSLNTGYIYEDNKVHSLTDAKSSNGNAAQSHPIYIREERIGDLSVDTHDADEQNVNEIIAGVALQLSSHLENLRLLEQTEEQSAQTNKLYEIGQRISIAKDQQEIIAAVAETTGISQINRAVMLSYEYNTVGELETIAVTGNWHSGSGSAPTPLGRRYPANVFTIVSFFNGTEPGFVGDTQSDKRVDPASAGVFKAQNIHAFASLPIWDNTRQIGSLLLESEEAIQFTGKELLPYKSIMQQVGIALENQTLFEQTQKRANQLGTVATLSTTASTVLDPDELLQAVVDLTKERFNVYHTHIYLADESWNTLLLAAGAGEVGREMVETGHAIEMDAAKSLVARAARERKAVIVNDVQSEADFLPNPKLPDTRAEIALPMIVGDKILGVFDVQSEIAGHFTEEDAIIYSTLASQVAVALQNARLYVEQAASVTQLRELDRLKSSFLANMSHELRTPLNSILGFTDVMLEELDGPLTANMDNDLKLIQKNGKHLLHLINDVLDMAKIESGKMNLMIEKFNLNETIEDVMSITSSLANEKSIALFMEPESDDNVFIRADHTRLRQVLINLLNNGIKFTDKGSVSVRVTHKDNDVLVAVKDTGLGIPTDHLESVFNEFTQVDSTTTRKAGGTGLGLPISRRLIEMHGGKLWAESNGEDGNGSTFNILLPIEAVIPDAIASEPLEKK